MAINNDIKKIDFTTSAFILLCPNGKVISIDKTKGLDYHIQYINQICKKDKEIKKLLSNINMKYYLENPAEVITDVIPLFAKNNYTIYMNLAPNTTMPTLYGLFFLPENIQKSSKKFLNNSKEKMKDLRIVEIGKYNNELEDFETFINEDYPVDANSDKLFDVLNNTINKNNNLTK